MIYVTITMPCQVICLVCPGGARYDKTITMTCQVTCLVCPGGTFTKTSSGATDSDQCKGNNIKSKAKMLII